MESHMVYLLHFSQRYKHALHYTGSTHNLTKRLNQHAKGQGARLLAVVQAAGITWTLARTWEGGKEHGAPRSAKMEWMENPIASTGRR
jgi:predicted GIY-YIG superfamily endonuclease